MNASPLRRLFGSDRARWAAILLLALAAVFGGNRKGVRQRDPLLYAAVARQMAEGGDLVVPRFGDEIYLKKPPLMMWLAAGSIRVFGLNDFALKLPALLFGVVAILLAGRLAWVLADREAALLAVLITVTSYSVLKSFRTFRLESVVTAATVGAVLVYLEGTARLRFPRWGGLAFFGIVAVGVLGKGYAGLTPLALVLFGCPRRKALLSPWFWGGILALVVPVGGWLLLVHRELGPDWTRALGADLSQYAGARVSGARFLDTVLEGFLKNNLPWTLLFLVGAGLAVRDLRRGWSEERGRSWLLLFWVLLVLAASLFKEKSYARYLVPAWPAVALLAAIPIRELFRGRDDTPLVGLATGAVLLVALLHFLLPLRFSREPYPFVGLAPKIEKKVPEGERLAVVGPLSPGRKARILLYLGRTPERIPTKEANRLADTGRLVLLYKEARTRLPAGVRFVPLHRDRDFAFGTFVSEP